MFKKKYNYLLLIVILTAFILTSYPIKVEADILTKEITSISADTYINEDFPGNNYGSWKYLVFGKYPSSNKRRHTLIKFNLNLPSNIEIVSAELHVYRYHHNIPSGQKVKVGVYRITKNWKYNEATWKKRTSSNYWSSPGGDYTHLYTTYIVTHTSPKTHWMVFRYLKDLVQYWVDHPSDNYGLIIVYISGSGLISVRSGNYGDADYRPYLKVEYKYKITITAPSSISISKGSSKTITVSISGSCPKLVNLKLENLPAGVAYTFNPSNGNSPFTSQLTITVASTAPAGTYNIKIKAYGTGIDEVKMIQLKITSGDFSLAINPPSINIQQGGSGTASITVNPIGGFSQTVTLSVQSEPSGFTVTINPLSITPGSTATITISIASSVSPGTYSVVIRGSGGGKTTTASLSVTVTQVPFNFDLQASPDTLNLNAGQQAVITITTTLTSGTAQPLSLSLSGLPAGTSYSFNPVSITPTGSSTLTIDTSNLDGDYTIIVTASGGGVSKQTTIQLHVTKQTFDFTISVSPSSVEINQGESTTLVVTVTKTSGTAKTVTLTLIGLPSGASYSFNPSSVTPTGSSVLTINSGSAKGTYTLLVKGTADGLEKTATFTLTIKEKKCIIATVTYGSEVSNEVNLLRGFRDDIVLNSYAGQRFYIAFNAFYYSWSPCIAQIIHENGWLKTPFKIILYPLIETLLVSTNIAQPITFISQELTVYLAGTMISAMLGIIYLLPILTLFKSRTGLKYSKYSIYIPITTLILCVIAQILCLAFPLILLTSIYVLSIIIAAPLVILKMARKYIK